MTHRDPDALCVCERMRDLAEADRARRVAHEVERFEDRHAPGLSRGVGPGNQHQPDDPRPRTPSTSSTIGARRRRSATRTALFTSPPLQRGLHDQDAPPKRCSPAARRRTATRCWSWSTPRPGRPAPLARASRRSAAAASCSSATRLVARCDGANLCPVAELEHGRDDVHDERSEELPKVVVHRDCRSRR